MESRERIRLRDADMSHSAMQIAMPLVIEIAVKLSAVGTAFNVVPELAISAAHVVDFDRWRDEGDWNLKKKFVWGDGDTFRLP